MKEKDPIPQGKYVPANRFCNLIYTAGMTPRKNGVLMYKGKIKKSDDLDQYKDAVELATSNALTAAMNCLEENEKLDKIIALTVYINAEEGFEKQSKIGDFASDFLISKCGECAKAARAAIGVQSLPGDAPVEIQIIISIKKD